MKQATTSPVFGLVVPVYNVRRYLPEALTSFLNQTYSNIRIYIVDDGSTDGSSAILSKYSALDNRIKVFHQTNMGVSRARNRALEELEKENLVSYVSFIDSDDKLDPQYCERFVQEMLNADADYGACAYKSFTRFSTREPRQSIETVFKQLNNQEVIEHFFNISINNPTVSLPKDATVSLFLANRCFRADLIKGIRFDEKLPNCEDQDFLIRVLSKIQKGIIIPKTLFYYRKRASSLSNSLKSKHNDFLVFERFYKQKATLSNPIRIGIENDFVSYLYQEMNGVLAYEKDGSIRRCCYQKALDYVSEFKSPLTPVAEKKIRRILKGYQYNFCYAKARKGLSFIRNLIRKIKYFP